MGRKRKIDENIMLTMITNFYIEKRKEFSKKPKFKDIANFIRDHGYEIEDRILLRNNNARSLINKLESNIKSEALVNVSIYHSINVENIVNNTTKENLISFLNERELYYSSLTESASKIFNFYKDAQRQIENKTLRIKELEKTIDEFNAKKYKENNISLKKENAVLKSIIIDYINPDFANKLLKDEGIIMGELKIIDEEKASENIISINSNIKEYKNKYLDLLSSSIKSNE